MDSPDHGEEEVRSVLADGVRKVLKDTQLPGIESDPLMRKTSSEMKEIDWQLVDYLRTPVSRRDGTITLGLGESPNSFPRISNRDSQFTGPAPPSRRELYRRRLTQ